MHHKPEAVRVKMLGGFSVSVGSRVLEENAWRLKNAAALVKLLALAPDHRLHREQVMDLLWPDSGRKAASNNLRRVLHSARRALDPDADSRYLASRDASLVLCPDSSLWVDAEAFEEAAATARHGQDPATYRAALDLYAGELLPADRYEGWAEEKRGELRRLYLDLLVGLAGAYEERGDLGRAVETLRMAVAKEPTLEEAHAGLMRLYALSGRESEALVQYERLREALSGHLGIEPGTRTRTLHEDIAAGRFPTTPGQHAGSSQVEAPDASKHNLPAPRSSLIGREREIIEIKRTLAMTRLLTLTGAGGCGKTRLALVVARDLVGAYPDGVWLVELASLSKGELVPKAVAEAVGIPEMPGRQITDALVESMRHKEQLLIVDNCEHLIEATARLVDTLLDTCPRLRVLATSREPLDVAGELNWPVPSLSVPDGQPSTVEEMEGYESVRLFVDRAHHRNPTFSLTSESAPSVARICARLEGIPLAIELAAARVGLSVEQIAARLDDSLKLLTAGGRTVSPRQRTLRGTLDWSYELLSEPERSLFCQLSVFAGGWTLAAAEAVGVGGGVEESAVLDVLSGLVEKSLVVAEAIGKGGTVRYRLLEPIRQYASEKFKEGGEVEEVRRRHAGYFLDFAEGAEPRLWGSEDVTWLDRLEDEHDNLRAALSWALERGEVEPGLRLAGAMWPFWEARGYYDEGRKWLEEVLEEEGRASPAVRAKALKAVGWLAHAQIDLDRAEAAARKGLTLSAEAELGGSLAASFQRMLGVAARSRGDYERAKALFEESLPLTREADDELGIMNSLLELGTTFTVLDDRERAKGFYEEGILLAREFGYMSTLASLLFSLGFPLLLEGDYERAAAVCEEAEALFRERGYKGHLEFVLDNLGWAALLGGDHERARTSFEESLTLCTELGDRLVASESLEGMACISGAGEASERAARLFGAAIALREALGDHQQTPAEEALSKPYFAMARSRLDESSWQAAWAEGRAMSMEQAIDYALSEEKPIMLLSPDSEHPSSDEPPSLTPREEEVALLVTQGLSNRQIASELFLSEHTVHHHLTNILKKLNLTSRQQVASRLPDR